MTWLNLGTDTTVNQLIFVAIIFRVLPMEFHFAAMNFRVYLASCLISFHKCIKVLRRFVFAKISREYYENKSLAKLNRFTVNEKGKLFCSFIFFGGGGGGGRIYLQLCNKKAVYSTIIERKQRQIWVVKTTKFCLQLHK